MSILSAKAEVFNSYLQRIEHRGKRFDDSDDSSHSYCTCTYKLDVISPDFFRRHLRYRQVCFGKQGRTQIFPKVGNQRNDSNPGEKPTSHHYPCDSRTQDETHTQKGRCGFHSQQGFFQNWDLKIYFFGPEFYNFNQGFEKGSYP